MDRRAGDWAFRRDTRGSCSTTNLGSDQGKPEPTPPEMKLPPPSKPVPTAREIAQPHLTWAEQETERVIDDHIKLWSSVSGRKPRFDARREAPGY
jgi:hypothetical protein